MKKSPVRIALVGCGAIAEEGYLPALSRAREVSCRILVDIRQDLAERLSRKWKIPSASNDFASCLAQVDAVVLSVPNHRHASMAIEALRAKKAVLCEKPLARSVEEAHSMIECAKSEDAFLAAGMILRQYPPLRFLRDHFPWDSLGIVQRINADYGIPLNWPVSGPYFFDKKMMGGGALIDQGVHLIDTLWWILGLKDAQVHEYFDDADAGVEAEAQGLLSLKLPFQEPEAPCRFNVSRLRPLSNSLEIFGNKAALKIPLSFQDAPLLIHPDGSSERLRVPLGSSWTDCFAEQLKALAAGWSREPSALAEGTSQLAPLRLIEECYRKRKPLRRPWEDHVAWT